MEKSKDLIMLLDLVLEMSKNGKENVTNYKSRLTTMEC